MKDTIRIEQCGQCYIGYFSNIPGCYVQGKTKEETHQLLNEALTLFIRNYKDRHEFVYMESDAPILNQKIKYRKLSAKNLARVLKNFNYHLDLSNEKFVILRETEFPFRRLLIPNVTDLNYELVCKIFGKSNVTVLPPKVTNTSPQNESTRPVDEAPVTDYLNDRV